MNFGEALEKVKNGDTVRRKGWKGNLSLRKDGSGRTTSNFSLSDDNQNYPWASPWEDLLAEDWEVAATRREGKDQSTGRADVTEPPLEGGTPDPPLGEGPSVEPPIVLPPAETGSAPNPNYYPNPSTPGYNLKRRNNNTIEDLDVKTEPLYNPDPRPDNRTDSAKPENLYNPRPDTALPLIPDHKITAPAFRSGPGNQRPDNPPAVPLNPTNPTSTDKPANPVNKPTQLPAEGRQLPETDRPETGPRPDNSLPDNRPHPDNELPENVRPDHSVPNQKPGNPGARPENPVADRPGSLRPKVDNNLPDSPKPEPKPVPNPPKK